MAEEFVNGFVHQNDIAVITRNPLKGDSGSMYRNTFTSGDFGSMPASDGEKKTKIWIILVVVVGLICLGIHIFLVWRFKRKPKESKGGGEDRSGYGMELKEVDNF
ncbi:hypothetical protein JHK82_052708 [Glycine max]|nr:hypothetical protein JHK84_052594 [Glycine max]KAG5085311.1 hypothetical protein JHK82_052708 [Glycine max]